MLSIFAAIVLSATPAKIVVIGADGVSRNMLEPLAKKGAIPNLKKLMDQGARGELQSIWPLRTPQVWTSAVTGKLPGQHGIWDHLSSTYFNPPEVRTKQRTRVASAQRKSKALWQLLDAKGIKSLTVGWMASWPPDKLDHGVMVAPIELMGDSRQTTIKGSFYSDQPSMVAPKKLWPTVKPLIVDPSDINDGQLMSFAEIPKPGSPLYALPRLERYVYALRWSLARAKTVEALTVELAKSHKPEVILTYFQCTDSLLHRFWIFQESEEAIQTRLKGHDIPHGQAAQLKKAFGQVVEACYRDLDARIGAILKEVQGPNTLVLVISDHGFGYADVPHRLKGEPYSGDHLDEGVILAVGPAVRQGLYEGASILDITPTLLHVLGLPVAKDMRGNVLKDLFTKGPGKEAVKHIATYETSPQLNAIYPKGWPPRKKPPKTVASQL